MRLKETLISVYKPTPTKIVTEGIVDGEPAISAVDNILQHCQPFIFEMGGIPKPNKAIYRGMVNNWPTYQYDTKPLRKAVGMSKSGQTKFDDFFEKGFGHRFRSVHVVFGTGNATHTVQFGDTHVIFPIGMLNYIWCPEIDDLNYAIMFDSVENVLEKYKFNHNTGLDHLGYSEVVINVKSYYAIPHRIYSRSVYPLLVERTQNKTTS